MASDTVQQIKEKLSIIEVVSPYVKLTRSGKYMKGLSPFTKEKSPSFFVNAERNSYYCFSTSQGGDIFTFIEKMEGVDFKGAVTMLAEKAGVEVRFEKGGGTGNTEVRDRLRDATAKAEDYYRQELREDGAAYEYARSRGLTPETIRAWGLGLAPSAWRAVLEHLTAAGFTMPELQAAGLVKESDSKPGTWYDRFRDRLMFPIRDVAGRTVAFTGRALAKDEQAKYLNSPETDLYKKSEILFGMDRAKDAIRTRGFAILVEGQFDLVLLHQAGFENTVALSGTALTPTHLKLMKRYADNVLLALDRDRAGLSATLRSALAALAEGMHVKAIILPEGKDPADIVSQDKAAFTKLVAESKPIVEFFLAVLSGEGDQLRLLRNVEQVILPLINAMQSPLEKEHFTSVVARAIGTTVEAVRGSLVRAERAARTPGQPAPTPAAYRPPAVAARPTIAEDPVHARRAREIQAIVHTYPGSALADTLRSEYARIIGTPLSEDSGIDERALFEVGLTYGESPNPAIASDLVRMFEKAVIADQLDDATRRLRLAEVAGDSALVARMLEQCRTLSAKLGALGH